MPDKRKHRGPAPDDPKLFSAELEDTLRTAARDFCWLLDRGYPDRAALKLVGDRFDLRERQRTGIRRASCSADQAQGRTRKQVDCRGQRLAIDGFNVLTTVESALAGALVLGCRDGTDRDLASMHGTYRQVHETRPAVEAVGRALAAQGPAEVLWLLDRPVSNSGRLAGTIREVGESLGASWTVELVPDPDPLLKETDAVVASADSAILDACARWTNLAAAVVAALPGPVWRLKLFPVVA